MNIRQLRETRRLKALLQAGETVDLCERDRLIGRIVPAAVTMRTSQLPDFASRATKIFGTRVLSGANVVIEERGRF